MGEALGSNPKTANKPAYWEGSGERRDTRHPSVPCPSLSALHSLPQAQLRQIAALADVSSVSP